MSSKSDGMYRNFYSPSDGNDTTDPVNSGHIHHTNDHVTSQELARRQDLSHNWTGSQDGYEYTQPVNGSHTIQHTSCGTTVPVGQHQSNAGTMHRATRAMGGGGHTTSIYVNGHSPAYSVPYRQVPPDTHAYEYHQRHPTPHPGLNSHCSNNSQHQNPQHQYNHYQNNANNIYANEEHIYQQPFAPAVQRYSPSQATAEYSNIYSVPSKVGSNNHGFEQESQRFASLSILPDNNGHYHQPNNLHGTGQNNKPPQYDYRDSLTHRPAPASQLYPIQDEDSTPYKDSSSPSHASHQGQGSGGSGLSSNCVYAQKMFHVIPPAPPLTESVFVGRRDVRNPKSVPEKEIVSEKGTVRGFTNRVRAGIATFWAQPEDQRNYRQQENGKIVVYATSMNVVRATSERCKVVRSILQNHMVRYEERDLYMSGEIQQELKHRLSLERVHDVILPQVFADGIMIGGAGEFERLNESGELRALLDGYQKINVRFACEGCGGYRFLPCEFCHGSKRSLLRNHFTEELCALRCMHCDENGLRRCERCKDQQE